MKSEWVSKMASAIVCLASILGMVEGAGAQATAKEPIVLADQRYFFVGGKYVQVGERKMMAGQMYVQYQIPKTVSHPYPIVMIHGTAQTGNNFLGTPDGRRVWADNFVAQGYRVYVVDQVGRARSGVFPDIYGPYARFPVRDLELIFTAPSVYNLFPQAKLHTQWPGGSRGRGKSRLRPVLRSTSGVYREPREDRGTHVSSRRSSAGEDRPVDPAHPLPIRCVWLEAR